MLTNWGEELYRLELNTCAGVFHRQCVCGKMSFYYEFKTFIDNAVSEIYRACVQPHFVNEDRVNDYLGYRLDSQLLENNLLMLDNQFLIKFERKVGIIFGFGLIRNEDDYSTEEYYSDEEYHRAPDSTFDELCF